jgi:hypothetical protein
MIRAGCYWAKYLNDKEGFLYVQTFAKEQNQIY